jgi:hypothetical protein
VPWSRLDLAAIERSLRRVQRDFPVINARLKVQRDPMNDEIVERMLAGYAIVDDTLARRIDLFAYGHSAVWLELNKLVLCGKDRDRLSSYAKHLKATEARFYGGEEPGIGAIVEWYARHRKDSAWQRAAGVYVRVLSEPQLYIEGNHRTGALIMSYILARDGKPPFVLSVENAVGYFDPSSVTKGTRKTTFALLFEVPKIKRRFAEFLQGQADRRYLADGKQPPEATRQARAVTG